MSRHPTEPIGPYRLIELIGEGGMGQVWLAEQRSPVRRRVAIKVIKLGMDTTQVVARFEAERQALAVMDHPNIAKIYDGGVTDDGRPYFAMELVKGQPITEFCDAERLSVQDRLRLFADVCRAVQHAHQKGVIHRDIKPSNLLVTVKDDHPVAKVIDFGIAKAVGGSLTDKTLHTSLGQAIGTLDYMSPEQANPESFDVDTRADVYSLGVVLHELLVGTRPYSIGEVQGWAMGMASTQKEAPKPSASLTRSGTQVTVAGLRATSVRDLRRELVGDLDWIVMKAIDMNRARRYETCDRFALDLRQYLSKQPVFARPPKFMYRAKKFLARNRAGVAAAGGIAAATLAGLTVAILGMAEARRQAATATSRELAAYAQSEMERDPELAILLAKRAAQTAPTLEAERALFESLQTRWTRSIPVLPRSFVAVSHDGRLVSALHRERQVGIWDVETGELVSTLDPEGEGGWYSAVFSPDGGLVATLSAGGIIVWSVSDGTKVSELEGAEVAPGTEFELGESPLSVMAFSADGTEIAAVGWGVSTAKWWDVRTGDLRGSLPPMEGSNVTDIAFGPDGFVVAAADDGTDGDGQISLRSLHNGEEVSAIATGYEFGSAVGVLSSDGTKFASTDMDRLVNVWDVQSGELHFSVTADGTTPYLAFSSDGSFLLTSSVTGDLQAWEVRSGREMLRLPAEMGVSWAEAGEGARWIATTHLSDSTLSIWDGHGRWEVFELPPFVDSRPVVEAGIVSAGGGTVVTRGENYERLDVWDIGTGRRLHSLGWDDPESPYRQMLGDIALSASGEAVAAVVDEWPMTREQAEVPISLNDLDSSMSFLDSIRGRLAVWEIVSGTEIALVPGLPAAFATMHQCGSLSPLTFRPDGKQVAAMPGDASVLLIDLASDGAPVRLESSECPIRVAYDPGGRRVAVVDGAGRATVWDVTAGEPLVSFGGASPVIAASFSPDGQRIATVGQDGVVAIWDEHAREVSTFPAKHAGGSGVVSDLRFDPLGERLMTVGFEGRVRFWDPESGAELLDIEYPEARGVSFSPSGEQLLVRGRGAAVFPYGIESLLRASDSIASRSFTDEECLRYIRSSEC